MAARREVRSASLLLNVLAYFLPFATLSCPGGEETFTGIQLVTGKTIEQTQTFGPPTEERIEGEPLAAAAFVVAIAGVGLGMLRGQAGKLLAVLAGGASVVLLLVLQSKMTERVQTEGMGMMQVGWNAGFWFAILAGAGAVVAALISDTKADPVISEPSVADAVVAGSEVPGS